MKDKNTGSGHGDTTREIDATIVLAGALGHRDENTFSGSDSEPMQSPDFSERFQYICDFGAGGVGRVAKARDLVFDRVIAVKSLNESFQDNADAVRSFIEECRLNAKLDHPSIVPVYDLGKDRDGHWRVAMKFINGSSLKRFINTIRGTYDKKKVNASQERHALISRLEYFLKICAVVEYCHSLKIVHGDIKPDNILMGNFGEVYLMDWGCARTFGTVPESLSGTPNYLPPEFLMDKIVTPLVDVYSLGMLLFEMTTLRRGNNNCPMPTEDSTTCCDVHNEQSYRHYLPFLKIAPRIRAIIRKAVNPDPSGRYQSVTELAADVRHFIYDEEVSAAPDNLFQKFFRMVNRNRVKSILITGLLFALLCGELFYSYYRTNRNNELRTVNTMRRLKLQGYTDILATAVEKNILQSQAQLLIFADNLIEDMQECAYAPPSSDSKFYSNEDYKNPETSPPGMVESPLYPNPVNLAYMMRMLPEKTSKLKQRLLDARQYVEICNKVISYDLTSHRINEAQNLHRELLGDKSMIQRLFVKWADGVRYVYPGTYDDPATATFRKCWNTFVNPGINRKIVWTAPYRGVLDAHRISCRYPMFAKNGNFLGIAGLELRLERLLAPLVKANDMDPVHELYLLDHNGNAVTVHEGRIVLLSGRKSPLSEFTDEEIRELARELRENRMAQFEKTIRGKNYFISGYLIKTIDGMLLQMIEENAMAHHNHKDITL